MLTSNDVVKQLETAAAKAGSQRALAIEIGVSAAYVSDILAGKREPFGRVLDYLGLERKVGYVPRQAVG